MILLIIQLLGHSDMVNNYVTSIDLTPHHSHNSTRFMNDIPGEPSPTSLCYHQSGGLITHRAKVVTNGRCSHPHNEVVAFSFSDLPCPVHVLTTVK